MSSQKVRAFPQKLSAQTKYTAGALITSIDVDTVNSLTSVDTDGAHGASANNFVLFENALPPAVYLETLVATVTDANTFTFANPTAVVITEGTATTISARVTTPIVETVERVSHFRLS